MVQWIVQINIDKTHILKISIIYDGTFTLCPGQLNHHCDYVRHHSIVIVSESFKISSIVCHINLSNAKFLDQIVFSTNRRVTVIGAIVELSLLCVFTCGVTSEDVIPP
jgi:hypothetical protein